MDTAVVLLAALSLALSVGATVGILALARELGQILIRIGPDSALPTAEGFDIGEEIPELALTARNGRVLTLSTGKRPHTLLVFVAPNCPACVSLLPAISVLARSYSDLLSIFLISNETFPDREAERMEEESNVSLAVAPDAFRTMRIAGTPFAMVLDSDKRLVSRGAPNSLAHLESLLTERYVQHRQAAGGQPVREALT
jgi:methylamine dehydrogenase accessory protein MauD